MSRKNDITPPLVSIVIINYNTAEVTIKSIQSILDKTSYSPYELIIIDNNSEDSDQTILTNFCQSKSLPVRCMNENLGWSKGVNYGFSIAQGKYLVTINSDVIIPIKSWLINMVKILQADDKVGAVNANIHENGKSIVSARNNKLKILHGACSIFSAKAWNLVGELDDKNFGFYGTENDWSYRARSMGFSLILSKDSVVNHLGSSIITNGGGLSVKNSGKSTEFFLMRLHDRVKFRVYNFRLSDWFSKQIIYEFKEAIKEGYLILLVLAYLKVFANIKNIYLARKQRNIKRKQSIKILGSC